VAQNRIQAFFQERARKNAQWRQAVDAQNVVRAREREHVSDTDLIATAPGIPNVTHQMELDRRLKVAIEDLTAEVVTSRKSADRLARRVVWASWILVALTVALVALTVVLAVRPG
jgi:hypothetical protein